MLKSMDRGEKGFTLVEILVVVTVLGILAAIVVPNFLSLLGSGGDEAAAVEKKMVQNAVIAYAWEMDGTFPDYIDDNTDLDIFFFGGVTTLKGEYSIDSNGEVSQNCYPGSKVPGPC